MPIRKVQVQHKFGIISHSQRIQLEERLTKKALAEPPLLETKKSPYEIDESFVDQYNVSKGADRKKLDEKAFQIVTRLKRRAGLKDGGQGLHVDAPRAWSELALLAQCQHEKLQEECLESLITSLDQALLSQYNIPCLFYLGKSCLHWLKRDAMSQPFLRTGELKLLTMAKLVFTRLYYHHIAGNLKDYSAEKTSLLQFLIGFAEQQDTYKPFPGALLAVRYIAEMGHKVCTWNQAEVDDEEQIEDAEAKETEENAPNTDINDLVEDGASLSERSSGARTIHDVSPTFWHALDIWRSVTHAGIGLKAALHGLTTCTTSLSSEPWLDVSCAFSILTEASKMDVSVLKTFQSLATGIPKNLVAGNHTSLHGKQYSSLMAKHETRQTQPLAYDQDNNYRSIESQKRQIITEIDPELLVEMTKTPTFINSLKRFADLDIVEESPDQDIANENESELAESEVSESTVIKAETLSTASQADESSVDNFRVADSLHKKKDLTRIRQERDLRTISRSSEMQNIESDNDSDEEEKDTAQISYAAEIKENEIEGVRFAVQDDLPKEEDSTGGPPDFAKLNRHDTATSLRSLQTQGSSVSIPLPEQTNEGYRKQ